MLIFIGCGDKHINGTIQIQTEIDTTTARIGDILDFSVSVLNSSDGNIIFPDIPETESMEIRSKKILSDSGKSPQVNFEIVFWDTGRFVLPKYSIEILQADSNKNVVMETDSIHIRIKSVLDGAENLDLRPIKDPIALRAPLNWKKIIFAILLVLLLLSFFSLWRTRLKQKLAIEDEPKVYRSAKEIAQARLAELEKMIDNDNKNFYVQSSNILREFIENQYYLRALEMTTEEIKLYDQFIGLRSKNFNELIQLLARADLAKFAKYNFGKIDRKTDFDWIKNFINNYDDKKNYLIKTAFLIRRISSEIN